MKQFALIRNALAAMVFTSTPLWAQSPEFTVTLAPEIASRPCASQLLTYLHSLAPDLTSGDLRTISVLPLNQAAGVFGEASWGFEKDFFDAWHRFQAADVSDHPIAPLVLNHILKMERAGKADLVLCRLNPGCRPVIGAAGHYPVRNLSFDIVAFEQTRGDALNTKMVEGGEDGIPAETLAQFPNVVFLSSVQPQDHQQSDAAAYRVAELIHEITHDHDYSLVDEWVKACLALKAANLPTDSLFEDSKIVRPSQSQEFAVEVDLAFLILFLESRAYNMTGYPMVKLQRLSRSEISELEKRGRKFARNQVHQLGLAAAPILKQGTAIFKGPIGEKNIFEFGVRIGQQMQETIDRFISTQPTVITR